MCQTCDKSGRPWAEVATRVSLFVLLVVGCRRANPSFYLEPDAEPGGDASFGDSRSPPDTGSREAPDDVVRDGAVAAADAACVPTALLGHWSFDETTGTIAHDSSCPGNDGVLVGFAAPAWRQGRVGGALELDGATQWVKVVDKNDRLNAIVSTNQLTLAAWVLRKGYKDGWASIVSRQYQDTIRESFALSFRDYAYMSTIHVPTFLVNSFEGLTMEDISCFAPNEPPLDQWVHLAGTYGGNLGRLYVDGVEACSFSYKGTNPAETSPLLIGANNNGPIESPTEWLRGLVDDVLIYSRALSAAEIAALAKGGTPPAR